MKTILFQGDSITDCRRERNDGYFCDTAMLPSFLRGSATTIPVNTSSITEASAVTE